MERSRVVWDRDKVKRSFLVDCESVNFIGVHGLANSLPPPSNFQSNQYRRLESTYSAEATPKPSPGHTLLPASNGMSSNS
ncbi:hypothetical protein ACFX2G_037756 [Malus domestica]